jgi:hypothetical protein
MRPVLPWVAALLLAAALGESGPAPAFAEDMAAGRIQNVA